MCFGLVGVFVYLGERGEGWGLCVVLGGILRRVGQLFGGGLVLVGFFSSSPHFTPAISA